MIEYAPNPETEPQLIYKTVDNIPQKYRSPESTDLTANVDEQQDFIFDMQAPPAGAKTK